MKTALLAALVVFPSVAAAEPMSMREAPEARSTGLDLDGDGVNDGRDNCHEVENAGQADADADGVGDLCDDDRDDDGLSNLADNCPGVANRDQADSDVDGVGNVCDAHFDTSASVDLIVAIASRSSELLPSGFDSGLDESVSLIQRAARAWDAQEISQAGYQVSLSTALTTLTRFETQLAARATKGQISIATARALHEASSGIRQAVIYLSVQE